MNNFTTDEILLWLRNINPNNVPSAMIVGSTSLDRYLIAGTESNYYETICYNFNKNLSTLGIAGHVAENLKGVLFDIYLLTSIGSDNEKHSVLSSLKAKGIETRTLSYPMPQFIRYNGIYNDKTVIRYDWMDSDLQYNLLENESIAELSEQITATANKSLILSYINIALSSQPNKYGCLIFCDSDKIRFTSPQLIKETLPLLSKYGVPFSVVNIPFDNEKTIYNDWSYYKGATVIQTDVPNLSRAIGRVIDKDNDEDIISAGLEAKQKYGIRQLFITRYNDVRALFLIDSENEIINITNNRIDQSGIVDRFNLQYMITSLIAVVLMSRYNLSEGLEFISMVLESFINGPRLHPIIYPLDHKDIINMRLVQPYDPLASR